MNTDNIDYSKEISDRYGFLEDTMTVDQKRAIDNVTMRKENSYLVGSFRYPEQKYWSDIDIRESFYIKATNDDIWLDKAENIMQSLVKKINNVKDYFISDIKCGIKEDFFNIINIGYKDVNTNEIKNFNPYKIKLKIDDLKNKKLLSEVSYNKINSFLIENITYEKWVNLDRLLSEIYIDIIENKSIDSEELLPYYVGTLKKGIIYNYDKKRINNNINELYNNNVLSNDEYKKISKLIKNKPTLKQWEKLNEFIRNLTILRWTPEDIKKGYVKYGKDNFYTDYLQSILGLGNHIVKIDTIGYLDFEYTELSNFMLFYDNYMTRNKKWELSNLPQSYESDYIKQIINDIEKLFYSPTEYNFSKGIKRMFSIVRYNKSNSMYKILVEFIDSDFSLLSKIRSQLETLLLLLEKNKKANIKNIKKQIDNMKPDIYHIIDIKFDKKKMIDYINDLLILNDKKKIVIRIEFIREYVFNILNKYVLETLKNKYDIVKIPNDFMPEERKYNSIIDLRLPPEETKQTILNDKIQQFNLN